MLLLRSTLAGRSGCDQCFFFVELDLTTLEVGWEDSRGTADSDATGDEGRADSTPFAGRTGELSDRFRAELSRFNDLLVV